jgi:hypothetical protein
LGLQVLTKYDALLWLVYFQAIVAAMEAEIIASDDEPFSPELVRECIESIDDIQEIPNENNNLEVLEEMINIIMSVTKGRPIKRGFLSNGTIQEASCPAL